MKTIFYAVLCLYLGFAANPAQTRRVFDAHIHGSKDWDSQLKTLKGAGVYKAALSTSWDSQNQYRGQTELTLLYGLMFPCPAGKVPYSLQTCYSDNQEWPALEWVESQIKQGKINFLGEILNEDYGISPSDSLLYPYYRLAQTYRLPVGIHTGGAGPDHGSPNFNIEMGDPLLLDQVLVDFPTLKLWIMHSGDQYYKNTIAIMQKHPNVYSDISVISNPEIVPPPQFKIIMEAFNNAGLVDRLLFGSDNGSIEKTIAAVEQLDFLTEEQKDDIFYRNAEQFFGSGK